VQAPAELAQEWPAGILEVRLELRGGVQRRPDVEELLRIQAAAADGALDGRPDVARAADADAGALLEEGACLDRKSVV